MSFAIQTTLFNFKQKTFYIAQTINTVMRTSPSDMLTTYLWIKQSSVHAGPTLRCLMRHHEHHAGLQSSFKCESRQFTLKRSVAFQGAVLGSPSFIFSETFGKEKVESTGTCCCWCVKKQAHPKTFKQEVPEKKVCACMSVCDRSQDEAASAAASGDVSLHSTSFSVTSAELIG